MAGVAIGAATRARTVVYASTFAAFWTRAFDQIRMGAISMSNANFVGSHAGVSIGEDGASQMALEDIAMFRSIPNSTVFYPRDAVSTERAVELAANTPGICFIRTSRPNFPVIYDNAASFSVGQARVVRSSGDDVCTVVAAGVTLVEAMKLGQTHPELPLRVIDVFTVKPLDVAAIKSAVSATNGRLVVAEDHYPEGRPAC
ncbi:transketolase-like protein 1 [Octopus sinensis]|uniref:transketolase n=1 Tax=Octopus sinensis TaxID=2607531 RepID=A0A6P7TZZ0_9MOLL|nr:transketolase-like protein 1 [Octopus sinensis]